MTDTVQDRRDTAPPPAASTSSTASMSALARYAVTFGVFLVILAALGLWLGGGFLNAQDRIFDLHQSVPVLLLALAAMIVLIVNQFDLSIGAMATLTAYLSVGLYANQQAPMWLSLLVCLLVGIAGGLLNALLVVRMNINAFIATIGTGGVLLGVSRVYSNGTVLSPTELPTWFSGKGSFGGFSTKTPTAVMWLLLVIVIAVCLIAGVRVLRDRRSLRGPRMVRACVFFLTALLAMLLWPQIVDLVPLTIIFLLAVALVLWALVTRTVFGRQLFATGGNPRAARLAGVQVDRQTTLAFVLTGILAASAGVVLAANQGSVAVDIAEPMLLPAYAAAFLSSVLLSRGRLHVWGCLLAGLFVVWVRQALIIAGVPFTRAEVVNGGVLIAAVAASRILSRETRP